MEETKGIKIFVRKVDYWEIKKLLDYENVKIHDFSVELFKFLLQNLEGREILKRLLTEIKKSNME